MRATIMAAIMAGLAAAPFAAAQVPRDPLANGPPATSATEGVPASVQRKLPPPYVTRQSDVEIPFSVRSGSTPETQPTAVRVFVSWDRGQSWHFYDERRAEEGRFRFRPRQDGEFWFATQTLDKSGRPDSPEPHTPQLRLVVDTQRPQLLIQTQVDDSGNVRLTYSAADPSLTPDSLKVEYQDAASSSSPWEAVALNSAATAAVTQISGQTTFHPAVSGKAINLRAEISDAAGNVTYYAQRLSLVPPRPASALAAGPAPDPSATPWPDRSPGYPPGGSRAPTSSVDRREDSISRSEMPAEREQVQIPNLVTNPFVGPGRLASATAGTQPAAETLPLPPPPAAGGVLPTDSLPPPAASGEFPAPQFTPSAGSSPSLGSFGDSPLSQFSPAPEPSFPPPASEVMPAPQPSEPVDAPAGHQPRLSNSRRFSLDYDVQSVGPEGVAAVELWGTTDGGRTWVKWGADPDKASPFDVEVNHEAIYGFRIVIVGKNGLATATPQPGDAADIWVGIDLTRPTARLMSATYGQGAAAGKLEIRWEAADANLGSRPISLGISDRPDGPFTPIATGLPNSGLYYWEYDPRSPRQIYLRLEVRDDAGNVAIDQLREPIKVEGLEPKGQIRGFNPGHVP